MTKSIKKSKKKEEKVFQNLLRGTEQFVMGKSFVSMSLSELRDKLSIAPQHQEVFLEILNVLVKRKVLELKQGRYFLKKQSADILTPE